ncbi:MAG: putative bacterial type secretion system protein [Fibrobacteres bacterium]|nr:putative bacterial type secretion system protein [Fibrobacterota bacterium]
MMKKLILLAAFVLPCAIIAQEDNGESQSPPPEVISTPPPMPPAPIQEQPPPPAGSYSPNDFPGPNPRRRMPGQASSLGDQERELLDKHKENASKGKASRGLKKPAETKSGAKGAGKPDQGMLNVDYVDEPILDVLRAIATAFKLSIIPDKDLGDVKVTIHLENIPVLEGLDKLCRSHGLEMIADGNVYRIRKTKENAFSILEVRNKRMNLDVQNRPVKDFLREFVEKTKINIVPGQNLRGLVTGHLKDVEPIDGFKALMAANDYDVRLKNGVYLVENGDSVGQEAMGSRRNRRGGGFQAQGGGASDVDVHDGKVTLSLNNASLGDAIREIAEQAGHNYTIIGDVSGNVNAQLKGVTVDEALSALLQGTRYAYINKDGTLLIGDRNPNTPSGQALSGAELVYLKYIKAENMEKVIPKSVPIENIKVIKEQNAVLISGTRDDIELVKSFLEKVDVPTPQVLMEVIVVEYNREKNSDFGIAAGTSNNPGANLNAYGSLSGVRNRFSQGSFQGVIGLLPPKFDVNLVALEKKNKAKILSMPKITTLNGNKAELKVSRTSYYPVSSVTKDGFQNNDFRTVDDGITIELTPWITKHGEVSVTISPSIKTAEQVTGNSPPPVTNRSIMTNVSLMDGETIALGGLITSSENNSREFVPILGSIPVLGYLFSWRKAHNFTTELVIYVTPHILNPESQAVSLEEEFESLDKRSGFLEKSDFLRSSKQGGARKETSHEETKPERPAKPAAVPNASTPNRPAGPSNANRDSVRTRDPANRFPGTLPQPDSTRPK